MRKHVLVYLASLLPAVSQRAQCTVRTRLGTHDGLPNVESVKRLLEPYPALLKQWIRTTQIHTSRVGDADEPDCA